MKILRLSSSNDVRDHVPDEARAYRLVERALAEATGGPVETFLKPFWPEARLPDLLEGWLERYQPDLVYISVSTFTFAYQSVPLRLERALGPLGRVLGGWGRRSADVPWLATNRVYRAARQALLMTVGGDTYFTPEEVVGRIEECLRLVLKYEGASPILRGPLGESVYSNRRRAVLRRERIRRRVHHAFKETCQRLHVAYIGRDNALDFDRTVLGRDQLHRNQEGHRRAAAEETAVMLEVWGRMASVRS